MHKFILICDNEWIVRVLSILLVLVYQRRGPLGLIIFYILKQVMMDAMDYLDKMLMT